MTQVPASSHGGGIAANGIVLSLAAPLDCRAVADHNFLWDKAYDNTSDYNTITSVPAALGLAVLLNGTSGLITTTTEGIWCFDLGFALTADATVAGFVGIGNVGLQEVRFGPAVVAVTGAAAAPIALTEILHLPAGAATNPDLATTVGATGNPWSVTPYLAISRLA